MADWAHPIPTLPHHIAVVNGSHKFTYDVDEAPSFKSFLSVRTMALSRSSSARRASSPSGDAIKFLITKLVIRVGLSVFITTRSSDISILRGRGR